MAKRKNRLDTAQYLKSDLLSNNCPANVIESHEEACIEIAASIKRALRSSGLSRDQLVDAINKYFGWAETGTKKQLTIHMLNHYLSKPAEYPIPASLIFAIQHITRSLGIAGTFAEAEGGRVITRDEIRELAIGKLDDSILEMQRLKRELRGGKR